MSHEINKQFKHTVAQNAMNGNTLNTEHTDEQTNIQ